MCDPVPNVDWMKRFSPWRQRTTLIWPETKPSFVAILERSSYFQALCGSAKQKDSRIIAHLMPNGSGIVAHHQCTPLLGVCSWQFPTERPIGQCLSSVSFASHIYWSPLLTHVLAYVSLLTDIAQSKSSYPKLGSKTRFAFHCQHKVVTIVSNHCCHICPLNDGPLGH